MLLIEADDSDFFQITQVTIAKFTLPKRIYVVDGFAQDFVEYHLDLLHEAQLVKEFTPDWNLGGFSGDYVLTWAGQEFLANIKNDALWEQAKKAATEATGGTSLTMLQRMAEKGVCAALGIPWPLCANAATEQ